MCNMFQVFQFSESVSFANTTKVSDSDNLYCFYQHYFNLLTSVSTFINTILTLSPL